MAEAATGITLMIEPGEYACPLRILALGASTRELAAESSWRVATSRPEQSVSVMSLEIENGAESFRSAAAHALRRGRLRDKQGLRLFDVSVRHGSQSRRASPRAAP